MSVCLFMEHCECSSSVSWVHVIKTKNKWRGRYLRGSFDFRLSVVPKRSISVHQKWAYRSFTTNSNSSTSIISANAQVAYPFVSRVQPMQLFRDDNASEDRQYIHRLVNSNTRQQRRCVCSRERKGGSVEEQWKWQQRQRQPRRGITAQESSLATWSSFDPGFATSTMLVFNMPVKWLMTSSMRPSSLATIWRDFLTWLTTVSTMAQQNGGRLYAGCLIVYVL